MDVGKKFFFTCGANREVCGLTVKAGVEAGHAAPVHAPVRRRNLRIQKKGGRRRRRDSERPVTAVSAMGNVGQVMVAVRRRGDWQVGG